MKQAINNNLRVPAIKQLLRFVNSLLAPLNNKPTGIRVPARVITSSDVYYTKQVSQLPGGLVLHEARRAQIPSLSMCRICSN